MSLGSSLQPGAISENVDVRAEPLVLSMRRLPPLGASLQWTSTYAKAPCAHSDTASPIPDPHAAENLNM